MIDSLPLAALDRVRIKPEFRGEYWARDIGDRHGVVIRVDGAGVVVRIWGTTDNENYLKPEYLERI